MSITRYPYKKLVKKMLEAVTEFVDAALKIKSTEPFIHPSAFRKSLYPLFLEKDEVFKELFDKVEWVSLDPVGEFPDGTVAAVPRYDGYLEGLFDAAMEEYCETQQETIKKINDMMSEVEGFNLASFKMELLYTDEEYQAAKIKAKELMKEYAEQNNFSIIKARLQIPSFADPHDLVEWLEKELKD